MNRRIRSSKPVFPQEDINKLILHIGKVLEEGQFRNGKNVTDFENKVAQYIGVARAVAFDSDSSAYETVLRHFDIKGKEVIVCTNSFISVPNSVLTAGGRVVYADIKEQSLSMDPDSLRDNLSSSSCGVIVTHIAGFPNPDLEEIMDICNKNQLFLIEDATHAFGATINNRKVGSFGNAAIFSFTPTKVITTGEGGMLVTNNSELSEFAKRFSFYGSGTGKTNFVDIGRHMVLPEISALLGIYQLKRIEEFIVRRNEIAEKYNEAFDKLVKLRRVKCPPNHRSSYYKYPLILPSGLDKYLFTRKLNEDYGIETGSIFYPPCHMQEVYEKTGAFSYGTLRNAEEILKRTIALPIHVGLNNDDTDYVIEKINYLSREPFLGRQ